MVKQGLWAKSVVPLTRCARAAPRSDTQIFPGLRRYASRRTSEQNEASGAGNRAWAENWLPKAVSGSLAVLLGGHIFCTYFYTIAPAYGISMLPTFQSSGDVMLISKFYRKGRGIVVGDVVSFKHPSHPGSEAVKRVLAMPGDFVLTDSPGQGEGHMMQVPMGHCFLVGDNMKYSRDSRLYGPIPLALLKGKILAKWSLGSEVFPKLVVHGLQDYVPYDDELD